MSATHETRTEERFTREPPLGPPEPPEPPEPPGPPESLAPSEPAPPGRGFAAIAVVALLVVGAMLATGFVLLAGTNDKSAGATATAPSAGTARDGGAAAARTPAAPAGTVAVTLKEFTVAPQPVVGRAGHVTFRVHNAGQVKHEFVVLRTSKPAGSLGKGGRADETGNVGEIGDLQPGASKRLTLPLKAGHYALICNLPGHYLAGQHADFTVR